MAPAKEQKRDISNGHLVSNRTKIGDVHDILTGVLPGHEVLPQGTNPARQGWEALHSVTKKPLPVVRVNISCTPHSEGRRDMVVRALPERNRIAKFGRYGAGGLFEGPLYFSLTVW
jgi:hypothetical protein